MIHYASFGRRVWAFLLSVFVDLLVLGIMQLVTGDGDVWRAFGFWYLLHHVGLVVEGGTIGHRLAGLRIVRENGERLGVVHAFVRELAKLGLSVPPLGLGLLWMLDQPRRQCWHDLIANSVVVRESKLFETAAPDWATDPPWRRPRADRSTEVPIPTPPPAGPHLGPRGKGEVIWPPSDTNA